MSRRGVKLAQQLLAGRAALSQQAAAANAVAGGQGAMGAGLPCLSRQMSSSSPPVNSKDGKVLHPDLLNDNLKKTQYAVRGELFIKADELRKQGREIIFTNGGRAQRAGHARACCSARAIPAPHTPCHRLLPQSATLTSWAPSR